MKNSHLSIDTMDRAILLAMQRDGRLTNAELAERVGLSPSACLRRVRLLEERGLIASYAAILDQRACGLPGTAFVHISLEQQGRAALDAFERAIARVPEILECHLLAGQSDYLVRVGINIVMYTLTGNYKADQVHIPALLERLGQ